MDTTKRYILALDQGTTSCRALLFDHDGNVAGVAQEEFTQFYPQPGWVEQDASEIWRVQQRVMQSVVESVGAETIAAIGITNQRETAVVWDRATGEPIHPAIVWQCRRSTEICERFRAHGAEPMVREKTGLLLDPYFSATKLIWLWENRPDLRRRAESGELLFGTIDSWLLWNLSGGDNRVHATDISNASRTLLFNIHTRDWDDELLALFAVPRAMLPTVQATSGTFCAADLAGVSVPVTSAAGDQQAALFGQGCWSPGMAKNTYGTGCFLLMNTGETPRPASHGLLSTVAWEVDGRVEYALEGSVFVAGAAIQWLRDGLGLIESASETEAVARRVEDTGGVYFVPAFTGLGAPYWKPEARGMITGITRGTRREHLIRAALESIAYQSRDLCDAMGAASGIPLRTLRVDGGAARNNFLLQFQADILNAEVARPVTSETTAMGAAFLAGLAVGFWKDREELGSLLQTDRRFTPTMDATQRDTLWQGWQKAVAYQA